jgi:hypothetical protein
VCQQQCRSRQCADNLASTQASHNFLTNPTLLLLQVVRPGGLVSIMCYIGHEGGLEEYEAVKDLLAGLSPSYWTSSELRLLNRPSAPVLLLLWRRPDAAVAGGRQRPV